MVHFLGEMTAGFRRGGEDGHRAHRQSGDESEAECLEPDAHVSSFLFLDCGSAGARYAPARTPLLTVKGSY
jgi:hypothetical protein